MAAPQKGVDALAAKLGTKSPSKPTRTPQPKPKRTPKAPAKVVPIKKKGARKSRTPGQFGEKMKLLKPRIMAMIKKGQTIQEVADNLGLSYSYTWVIARDYKYDREATAKRRAEEAKRKKPPSKKKSAPSKVK
jgi:hypothetical protein